MDYFDVTESKARNIVEKICKDFNTNQCNVYYVDLTYYKDNTFSGLYVPENEVHCAYMLIEKAYDSRLLLVLHEISHHLQLNLYGNYPDFQDNYPDFQDSHGATFELSKRRMATWAKHKISRSYDWYDLITKCNRIGRMKR